MTRSLKIVLILLTAVASITAEVLCELDEFKCDDDKCIPREKQCNTHPDCANGEDEKDCTVLGLCDIDEFTCKVNKVLTCYSASKDICVLNGLEEGFCDDKEDLKNCVCDPNDGRNEPIRCPTDNVCYPGTDMVKFCENCPLAKTCDKQVITKSDCEADLGYKYCEDKTSSRAPLCLPVSSFCDPFSQCASSADNADYCKAPTITNMGVSPGTIYIGDTITLTYRVSGYPKPQYKIYHYNKLLPLPFPEYEGASISVVYEQLHLDYTTLTITIANINEYFYGNYDVVVWNVVGTPAIEGDASSSYHRRVVADQTAIHFDGVPTAAIIDSDDLDLAEDSDVVWQTSTPLRLRCRATGKPEPTITFTQDGDTIYKDDNMFDIEHGDYNEGTMTRTSTLILQALKGTPAISIGRYSCKANSILGETVAQFGVNIDLIIEPVISKFTGMAEGKQFSRIDEDIDIECDCNGYPGIWVTLNADEGATGAFTKVEAQVTKDGKDKAKLTYTYRNKKMTVLECVAQITTGDQITKQNKQVTFYPISEPTIVLEKDAFTLTDNQPFSTTITVTFTETLTENPALALTAVVVKADGSALNAAYWTLKEKDGTAGHVIEFDLSVQDPGIGNLGSFKVKASDTLYDVEASFSVDVTVPMHLSKTLAPTTSINQHNDLTLEVTVLAKPAPTSVVWTFNEVKIENDATTTISDEFDDITHVTKYTLKIKGILKDRSGNYKVVIKDATSEVVSSTVLTVNDHPCTAVPTPCQNEGTCKKISDTDYECECTHVNFEGKNCDENTFCDDGKRLCDAASPSCEEKPFPVNYECKCPYGRTGKNCDIERDFCAEEGNTKCDVSNGNAKCVNTNVEEVGGYECYCKHDKGGQYCNMVQMCTPNPCANGATCSVTGYEPDRAMVCECITGWTGDKCEDKKEGHCWTDCNDRAICEEEGVCLCEYPYYGDKCELVIHDNAPGLHIAARGYLEMRAYPTIAEEKLQKYILPLKILTADHSCRIARMSANDDGSGDYLEFALKKTGDYMEFYVNAEISGSDTAQNVNDVTAEDVVSITLAAYNSYTFISIHHSTGVVVAVRLSIDLPELAYLKLSDFEAGEGCELALIGEVTTGPYQFAADDYDSGRSVKPLEPCYHNPCLNGGKCVSNEQTKTQSCDCAATAYTGDLCETPVDDSCDRGCLFGGECHSDSCLCALPFLGVLCESSYEVTDHMKMAGENSEIVYSNTGITSIKIKWVLPESFSGTDFDLLTLGTPENSVKIFVAGADTELYMIVNRAEESGAYNGLGRMADLIHNNEFHLTISFVEEDIHINSFDGTNPTDTVVIGGSLLPCADGLGTIDGLVVHGITGVSVSVRSTINDEIAMATGGMGLVNNLLTDLCDGACGDGTCTLDNNQIKCSGCPEGTNPVTCSAVVCDPAACQGTCTDIGECVCGFGKSGPNCDNAVVFTAQTLPVTTSSYFSYAQYTTEKIEGDYAAIQFNVKVEGSPTIGLLAFAGNEYQHIAVKIDGDKIKAKLYCSEIVQVELAVSGVNYADWLAITVDWDYPYVTLKVNDADAQVDATGVSCYFLIGSMLYLGGMPGGMVPGVKATFAPPAHIVPPSAELVGGQSLANSALHVCDTLFSPCSALGAESCVTAGDGYTCTCKSGFRGDHCETAKTPCDEAICSDNEVCVEADGSCICKFGFGRGADNVCEDSAPTFKGFCMESPHGFAVINLDPAAVANNFDMVFRFYLPAKLDDGTYDLGAISFFIDEEGSVSDFPLNVTVLTDSSSLLTTYSIQLPLFEISEIIDPGYWHVIRVQTSGVGTNLEINDETYATDVIRIYVVNSIKFGINGDTGKAYQGCISDIIVNGEQVKELDDGAGVKSCDDKVPTDYERRFGSLVWAELGLL